MFVFGHESPFNLVIRQPVGKSEYFMERLPISEIGFSKVLVPSFRNFPERLSIPAALSIFIFFSNCSTKSSVTF